jgi:hypothetical protein
MVLGTCLVLAGCGGETTPAKTGVESKPAAKAAPTAKRTAKRRGETLAEGGDKTAQERRAERLKAKKTEQ